MNATTAQLTDLKALSARVLQGNSERNVSATPTGNVCNNALPKGTQQLHVVARGLCPVASPSPTGKDVCTTSLPVEITRAGIVTATPPRCYACKSTDLWHSRHGVTVCRRCHAPAPGAEVTNKEQA